MPRTVTTQGPHPVDVLVGRRFTERRISLGHRQSDLGRALGLTFQKVQKYEKGTNRISASKLWDAALFLGVGVDYFFEALAGVAPAGKLQTGRPSRRRPASPSR